MDGLLIIDKPAGPTSHDVVARMRRVLQERRIGHTGTLDPAATGVLPLVLGRATRLARFLSASDKWYEADIRLGVATETYDATGAPVGATHTGPWPCAEEIFGALAAFRGEFLQHPPAFSAKKIAGQRSYRIARRRLGSGRGQVGVRPPSDPGPRPAPVTAHAIDLIAARGDRVSLRIHCSAGFYVRSLAHDLGQRLGIGAHLAGLRRTRSGDFSIEDALALEAAEADAAAARAAILPLDRMLPALPAAVLTEHGVERVKHGRDLRAIDVDGEAAPLEALCDGRPVRLLDAAGHLLAIAERTDGPDLLHPSIVLV
jgi:tRNA pseudouridine55 synthase